MNNLKEFRQRKNEFFASDSNSPLTREQKRDFDEQTYRRFGKIDQIA
jgi:hypothetical protein